LVKTNAPLRSDGDGKKSKKKEGERVGEDQGFVVGALGTDKKTPLGKDWCVDELQKRGTKVRESGREAHQRGGGVTAEKIIQLSRGKKKVRRFASPEGRKGDT